MYAFRVKEMISVLARWLAEKCVVCHSNERVCCVAMSRDDKTSICSLAPRAIHLVRSQAAWKVLHDQVHETIFHPAFLLAR